MNRAGNDAGDGISGSIGHAAAVLPEGVDEYLKWLAQHDGLTRLHRSVLRSGATDGRELLAAEVSSRRLTWGMMRDLVLGWAAGGQVDPAFIDILDDCLPRSLLKIARVVALQNLFPSDRRLAYAMYRLILDRFGERIFASPHHKLFTDLAVQLGDHAFAERLLQVFRFADQERSCLHADAFNPFVRPGMSVDDWLREINATFIADGVAPVQLSAVGGGTPFDRLTTGPLERVDDPAKVTVAITTWCPDEGFPTAFRSISEQTWRNLEILVLDDCSPSEYLPLLERVVATDPRARLIRMPENRGTYRARNRALSEATGEFFTVHDSDDWAHPQRLERQVRRLQQSLALVSTGSRALRADEVLLFNLPGVSASRENASSLTFRREPVMSAIGFYDASRKGADTEYAVRMIEHFGPGSHEIIDEHLAFIRLRAGSLSREEFKPGWRHPSRMSYRLGYQWAHARRKAVGKSLRVEDDGQGLELARPVRFLLEQGSAEAERRRTWDVVFAFDARSTARQPLGVFDEMFELAHAGARVAVMHMESFLYPFVTEVEAYAAELQEYIGRGLIGEVLSTDDAAIETLVIRAPSVLQFVHPRRLALRVSRVLLVPDDFMAAEGAFPGYTVLTVEDHAFQLFGCKAPWLLGDGGLAAARNMLRPGKVDARAWNAIRSPRRWRTPRPRLDGTTLRVGRVFATLGAGSAPSASARVCLYGGEKVGRLMIASPGSDVLPEFVGREFPDAAVYLGDPPGECFFALVDVYVLHGADPRDPAERVNAITAAAAGCIVLWDKPWAAIFGDGMLCCTAGAVPGIYQRIRASGEFEAECRRMSGAVLDLESNVRKMVAQLLPSQADAAK